MSNLTLNTEQVKFLKGFVQDVKDLLDNVHCYETEEFRKAAVAQAILNGASLEQAQLEYEDEDV